MRDDEQTIKLTDRILAVSDSGGFVDDVLRTDERVLARITDGIYRQPASALRELIANAYDADAKSVVIDCDPPRFNRITVRDDGSGMSAETLAHVIHHIGGSLKRTRRGSELLVASEHDNQKSPGGRKLIGRIGIGLFSVVQLTPHFQIITKTKGSSVRIVADIIMAAESIEQLSARSVGEDDGKETKELTTGKVRIWTEPALDSDSHGTDIVLMDIRPQTKEMLRSSARWQALRHDPSRLPPDWLPTAATAPAFHIGGLSFDSEDVVETPAVVPWERSDAADERFKKLVDGVRAQARVVTNPEIKDVLDNYFQMIWTLALGLPLSYVGQHPFDVVPQAFEMFQLSNDRRGQPTQLARGTSARDQMSLVAPSEFEDSTFSVIIDGMSLARPIEIERADIRTTTAVTKDLIFFGSCTPDLAGVAEEFRGGKLSFEAYIYWSPKIVPKDHNGVLVRIKGASGTLFDRTFLGYQVAENTRLKQLTAEIFVKEGLEGALNIDRESFNYANTHYQFISRWLHGAIRQVANRHKSVSKAGTNARRVLELDQLESEIQSVALTVWSERTNRDDELPPAVHFKGGGPEDAGHDDGIVFSRERIYGVDMPKGAKILGSDLEARLSAIYQILFAYGLVDSMTYEDQQSLIADIARVLNAEAKKNG